MGFLCRRQAGDCRRGLARSNIRFPSGLIGEAIYAAINRGDTGILDLTV